MTTFNMRAGQSVELRGGRLARVVELIDEVYFTCQKFMTVEDMFMCGEDGLPTMAALDHRERFLNIDVVKEKIKRVGREVEVVYGKEPPEECQFFCKMTYSGRGNTFEDYEPGGGGAGGEKWGQFPDVKTDDGGKKGKTNLLAADLYCGCGGLSFACIEGRITPKVAVENNRDACDSYQANHPNAKVHNMKVEEFNLVLKRLNELEERNEHKIQGEDKSAITQVAVREGRIEFRLGGVWLSEEKVGKEELGKFLKHRESNGFPRPGTIGIVMGGTPCQDMSGANIKAPTKKILQKKSQNYQINLFMDAVKLLNPDFVLLENIKDILRKDDGVYGKCAGLHLLNCGYQIRMGVLAAGNYGAPQERLRCFIWGAKSGKTLPGFPKPLFAMPDSNWRCQAQNCDVRLGEDITGALFPHITLGDIMSDLPPSSNFARTGLYEYKSGPKTPIQVWLRRPTGENSGSSNVTVPESRKRLIDELVEETKNEGGSERRKRRRLRVKLGKRVMAEDRSYDSKVSKIPQGQLEKELKAQLEVLQWRIGEEVLKTEKNELKEARDPGEFLFDHLPDKMSSVDFERVMHLPVGDGVGVEKMPGIVQRNGGFCCGYEHAEDCPAPESEDCVGVDRTVPPHTGFIYRDGCESKGFILSSKRNLVNKSCLKNKNASFRRVDRWGTVGTLVGRSHPHMTCTRGMLHNEEDRCLTAAECKRIQGFPDNYILSGSPSSKNAQIGNAVSPHCAESLGYCLVRAMDSAGGARQKFIVNIKARSKMAEEIHKALQKGILFFNGNIETIDLTLGDGALYNPKCQKPTNSIAIFSNGILDLRPMFPDRQHALQKRKRPTPVFQFQRGQKSKFKKLCTPPQTAEPGTPPGLAPSEQKRSNLTSADKVSLDSRGVPPAASTKEITRSAVPPLQNEFEFAQNEALADGHPFDDFASQSSNVESQSQIESVRFCPGNERGQIPPTPPLHASADSHAGYRAALEMPWMDKTVIVDDRQPTKKQDVHQHEASAGILPMSLETYIDMHSSLTKGRNTVQPVSNMEQPLYRIADLKQIFGLHGYAFGKTKKESLAKLEGQKLFCPELTSSRHKNAPLPESHVAELNSEILSALGWAAPSDQLTEALSTPFNTFRPRSNQNEKEISQPQEDFRLDVDFSPSLNPQSVTSSPTAIAAVSVEQANHRDVSFKFSGDDTPLSQWRNRGVASLEEISQEKKVLASGPPGIDNGGVIETRGEQEMLGGCADPWRVWKERVGRGSSGKEMPSDDETVLSESSAGDVGQLRDVDSSGLGNTTEEKKKVKKVTFGPVEVRVFEVSSQENEDGVPHDNALLAQPQADVQSGSIVEEEVAMGQQHLGESEEQEIDQEEECGQEVVTFEVLFKKQMIEIRKGIDMEVEEKLCYLNPGLCVGKVIEVKGPGHEFESCEADCQLQHRFCFVRVELYTGSQNLSGKSLDMLVDLPAKSRQSLDYFQQSIDFLETAWIFLKQKDSVVTESDQQIR
ncbi:hypothetical protein BSKO_06424 [Bryopsis sp. KO-2023]|nr:hypothetical protein BSKO_06424 [Bryopsis sp. KO-2023]